MIRRITSIITSLILFIGILNVSTITAQAATLTGEETCRQVFDADYYAANNADVVNAVGTSSSALLKHYMQSGIYEGRSASATFNATAYKNRYADLRSIYGEDMIKYVVHYVSCGQAENRDANATTPGAARESTTTYTYLGSYTTRYNSREARATNVNLAASLLSGTIVPSGAEFSFTNTIGPRTIERGFVEAPVFVNKEHSMGIGGGICQVSSTLYATMRTIGLPATERHPHSLPVSYLPEGWDATVSGTTLDLKFINTYSRPILITTITENGRLTVNIYLRN